MPNGGVGTLAYLVSMFIVFLGGVTVMVAIGQPKPSQDTAVPVPAKKGMPDTAP